MIVVAAIWILVEAIQKWIAGLQLEHLGSGVVLLLAAGMLNAWLGWYLLRVGKRSHSLILEADGKHVLTDCFTSFGVVGGTRLSFADGMEAVRSAGRDRNRAEHFMVGRTAGVALGGRAAGLFRSGKRQTDSREAGRHLHRVGRAISRCTISDYRISADH